MNVIAERAALRVGGTVVEAKSLSGGSLSEVVWLRLADGRALVAKQSKTAAAEADMLRAIAATGAPSPPVVGLEDDLLVMAAVASEGRLGGPSWDSLAEVLDRLHAACDTRYGWPHDHAFGPVAIANGWADDWSIFWAENRLRCHVPHIATDLGRRLDRLADRLASLLPGTPCSVLLHGDLWGGNVLVGDGQVTALIDPACYHGDREADVAMLTLFDRPPDRFVEALNLDVGWRDRLPIYRLWPLLVHLRLFGSGYGTPVSEALRQLGF